MERAGRVEPCEILRAVQHSAHSTTPALMVERVAPRAKWRLTLTLTPLDAFAVGALAVSALALAWSMGTWAGNNNSRQKKEADIVSLEDVQRLPPVRYEELTVDRGMAD